MERSKPNSQRDLPLRSVVTGMKTGMAYSSGSYVSNVPSRTSFPTYVFVFALGISTVREAPADDDEDEVRTEGVMV
jgi:hypothetical protein